MRARLTKRFLDSLTTAAGEVVWDVEQRGFGVRVKPSGVKSFVIQYRNANGASRRYTIGQYGAWTVEAARRKARQLLAAVDDGKDPAAESSADREAMTVAELCNDYLKAADDGSLVTRRGGVKKASTIYTDKGRIERHIKKRLGRRLVKDITTADIEKFQRDVIEGKTAADVKTGPHGRAIVEGGRGTAARTVGLLGGIFSFAVKNKYRADNPVRGVVRPKDGKRVVHIDADRYRALGEALDAADARGEPSQAVDAIWLLAVTGCRKGEVQNLRWDEVDFAGRCLRIGDTKTGFSVRPLGSPALDLLRRRKAVAKGGFVFPGRRGKPYGGLDKAWDRIIAGDLLDDLTRHDLRHGFTSAAEAEGLTLPTIRALVGHASRGVTEGYIHKTDAALVAAADRVARTIHRWMTGEKSGTVVELPTRGAASTN